MRPQTQCLSFFDGRDRLVCAEFAGVVGQRDRRTILARRSAIARPMPRVPVTSDLSFEVIPYGFLRDGSGDLRKAAVNGDLAGGHEATVRRREERRPPLPTSAGSPGQPAGAVIEP